jgi:hypothetical protein
MKVLVLFIVSIFSTAAFAHTGHGATSALAHDIEHMLWMVSGLALLLSIIIVAYKKYQ